MYIEKNLTNLKPFFLSYLFQDFYIQRYKKEYFFSKVDIELADKIAHIIKSEKMILTFVSWFFKQEYYPHTFSNLCYPRFVKIFEDKMKKNDFLQLETSYDKLKHYIEKLTTLESFKKNFLWVSDELVAGLYFYKLPYVDSLKSNKKVNEHFDYLCLKHKRGIIPGDLNILLENNLKKYIYILLEENKKIRDENDNK